MWNGTLLRGSAKQGNDNIARSMESAHRTSLARAGIGVASNMKRRNFIGTLTLAASAALFSLPALPSRKIDYLDEISPNYRAWRDAGTEMS